MDYYVYAYLRAKTSPNGELGSPYYIGKGKGVRSTVRHLDCGGRPPKDLRFILKIFDNLSEDSAFKLEIALIKIFGRINNGTGCLRNLTDGGAGSSGRILTEESRRRMSLGQKERFKTEKPWNKGVACPNDQKQLQREKMLGRQAWNKGKPWPDEVKQKLSESHKGKPSSRKGAVLSTETRKKISESLIKRNRNLTIGS